MRLAFGAAAAAALVAAAPAAPARADVPTRTCSTRVEAGHGPGRFPERGLRIGPVALTYADSTRMRVYRDEHGRWFAKAGLVLRAGHRATLSVPPRYRGRMLLAYARPDAAPAVRFVPCPPQTRAFSYEGVVGAVTAFNGGFVVDAPGCYALDVRIDGGGPTRVRLPLGRRCR